MNRPRIQISWSGGKDSALALHKIIALDKYEVVGLHTVIENDTKRVGIHDVKEKFIEAQAKLIGLPLTKLYLPKKPMAYEKLIREYYTQLKADNVNYIMFGDIFLEDLKDFREQLLTSCGIEGVYPLWKRNTGEVVCEFLETGYKTILCAVDAKYIESKWAGEALSYKFLDNNPSIDPCGENGEYHSLVVDGPIFKKSLDLQLIEKYEKDFVFNVKNESGQSETLKDKFYFAEFSLNDRS